MRKTQGSRMQDTRRRTQDGGTQDEKIAGAGRTDGCQTKVQRKSDEGRSSRRRWQHCHSQRYNATMALLLQRNDGVATRRSNGVVAAQQWWSSLQRCYNSLLQFITQRRCDVGAHNIATLRHCYSSQRWGVATRCYAVYVLWRYNSRHGKVTAMAGGAQLLCNDGKRCLAALQQWQAVLSRSAAMAATAAAT